MKTFFRTTVLISILSLFATSSFAEKVPYYRLNLRQCMDLALKNNQEILATREDVAMSIAKKIEATKRYVPVVNYKYRMGPVPRDLNNAVESLASADISVFNSFHVDIGVPLSTFGRLQLAQELADIGIDASGLQGRQKSDEVLLNVYKLYQGILFARESQDLAQQGLDAVDKKIEDLSNDETRDQLALLKLKVVLYEIERKKAEADMKETLALATLKVLMGLEDDVDFDIKDQSLTAVSYKDSGFDKVLELAKNYRPEFQLLNDGLAAKAKNLQLQRKEYFPKLGVGGFADVGVTPGIRGDESDNDFVNPFNYKRVGVGVELNGSLDFRQIKAKVSTAEADYLKTVAQKRAAVRGLELDIKNAYLDYQNKKFLLSRAKKDEKSAREIVFLTKSNVDLGIGESKDYLDALQSYLVFQHKVNEATFDYNNATATLRSKTGTLYPEQKNGDETNRVKQP